MDTHASCGSTVAKASAGERIKPESVASIEAQALKKKKTMVCGNGCVQRQRITQ
jgi:hypothetical protein